jgi:putative addiction module killer protein
MAAFNLVRHPEFSEWFASVKDGTVRVRIAARLKRLEVGLLGDVEPVGEGVSELRIHIGAGWRVYYVQRGQTVIVLLCGGTKGSQDRDIKRAKELASGLD